NVAGVWTLPLEACQLVAGTGRLAAGVAEIDRRERAPNEPLNTSRDVAPALEVVGLHRHHSLRVRGSLGPPTDHHQRHQEEPGASTAAPASQTPSSPT